MRNKTLTDQELESAYLARYDLGPGYPQLMVPEFISQLYLDDSIEEKSLRFPPNWSPEMQANVDRDLSTSLRKFIRLDTSEHFESYVTFSGSIALDRAIASVQIASKRKNKKNIHVVTTSPCIDIMRLFLCERADVTAHFVESYHDGIFGAICADTLCGLLKELSERFPEDQLEHR